MAPILRSNQSYGATHSNGSSPILDRVIEESPSIEDAEFDLEDQDYFIGSYKRFIALYTIVPLSSIIGFVILAVTPALFFPAHPHEPHSKYFPIPIPELLSSAALWSLSHLLRFPSFAIVSSVFTSSNVAVLIHTVIHTILYNLLRLSILPILSIREDMEYPLPTYKDNSFTRIWWASLGWSLMEVAVAIWQGYEQVALYKDIMIPESKIRDMLFPSSDEQHPLVQHASDRDSLDFGDAIRSALDQDLDRLVSMKAREELELVYGIPVIDIPVIITTLQRLDSILLSLGLSLLISHSYLSSTLSDPLHPVSVTPTHHGNRPFAITFPIAVVVHIALAMLYTPAVLPRIRVHTAAYVSLLGALSVFFAGLGVWGALS